MINYFFGWLRKNISFFFIKQYFLIQIYKTPSTRIINCRFTLYVYIKKNIYPEIPTYINIYGVILTGINIYYIYYVEMAT